ncbi:hypothetical protein OG589_29150 [Sphaerisporangium sp. NBC_01403]|uniref:hypothetical protein n=1 Tax=Sphaerisporangium sp. NBC_01403 TaxID=2903599 RepID=UPI003247E520
MLGLFGATSVPTSQGLDVTFNLYQYGGTQAAGPALGRGPWYAAAGAGALLAVCLGLLVRGRRYRRVRDGQVGE